MIRVDSHLYFIAALALLILPLDWLTAAIAAAIIHELSHILALYTLSGSIRRIQMNVGGCVIESDIAGTWQQVFCILAGPVGSFLMLFFCRIAPKAAICGLFQGMYNLMPVLPLDGGRILQLILYRILPKKAENILFLTTVGTCLLVDLFALRLLQTASDKLLIFMIALIWNIRFLPRKIPCKQAKSKVQ